MPIILNGSLQINVASQDSQPDGYKWDNDLQRIVKVEEKKPEPFRNKPVQQKTVQIVHKQVIEKETVGPPDHYHHEQHGDLHKFFNTKSDYLKDMIDFDSNK